MVKEEGVPTEGGGVSGDGEALAEEEIAAAKGALGRGQVVGTEARPHGYEEEALVAKDGASVDGEALAVTEGTLAGGGGGVGGKGTLVEEGRRWCGGRRSARPQRGGVSGRG